MNKIQEYINKRHNTKNEYLLFNKVPIIIQDRLKVENDFNISDLVKNLESLLPIIFKSIIKSIIILDSPVFDEREVNAFYQDSTLYISNEQDDLNDIIDDIVHEFAHALEVYFESELYGDGQIKDEFLKKRTLLKHILKYEGLDVDNYDFNMLDYTKTLDDFFYKTVTYEKINNLTNHGLLITPYAITSLQEYFATGFEEYILGDGRELSNISPKLFAKIKNILEFQY